MVIAMGGTCSTSFLLFWKYGLVITLLNTES